jgi:hypothetical protein
MGQTPRNRPVTDRTVAIMAGRAARLTLAQCLTLRSAIRIRVDELKSGERARSEEQARRPRRPRGRPPLSLLPGERESIVRRLRRGQSIRDIAHALSRGRRALGVPPVRHATLARLITRERLREAASESKARPSGDGGAWGRRRAAARARQQPGSATSLRYRREALVAAIDRSVQWLNGAEADLGSIDSRLRPRRVGQ